ncbi:MAG: tryptophan synthase subunit beta, partial [Nocardioidaceae bacterium]
GIIPAIESAHALAGAYDVATELGPDATLVVCLSGRGDKDMVTAATWFDLVDLSDVVEDVVEDAVGDLP